MYLKQSTVHTVRFGPFIDDVDGTTTEDALTIAQADMRLSKDGGAFAQKNATGNATNDSDGWYSTSLNATDTATVGELILNVEVAGAMQVWMRWWVLEEVIFDALFGAAAAAFDASDQVAVGSIASGAITAASVASDAVTEMRSLVNGTADAGSTTTSVRDAARTESVSSIWEDCWLLMTSGTLVNQVRLITSFDPINDDLFVRPAFSGVPGAGDTYEILPAGGVDVRMVDGIVAAAENLASLQNDYIIKSTFTGTPTSTTGADTSLAEASNDHYNNRTLVFTSGILKGQLVFVTDYVGATNLFTWTVTPTAEAPSAGDGYILL